LKRSGIIGLPIADRSIRRLDVGPTRKGSSKFLGERRRRDGRLVSRRKKDFATNEQGENHGVSEEVIH
jgi:hypothetical protein